MQIVMYPLECKSPHHTTGLSLRSTLAALALTATLVVTGCTADSDTDAEPGAGSPSGTGTATSAPSLPDDPDSPLRTTRAADFTEEAAALETVRIADEIQDLIDPSTILNVDDHPEVLATEDGTSSYYGVLRLVSITEGTEPTLLAKVLVAQLGAAGWTEVNTEDTEGSYFVALTSSNSEADAWFLLIGGDTSEEGFPAVTIQLASPTLT
jgi:hypothetical protein